MKPRDRQARREVVCPIVPEPERIDAGSAQPVRLALCGLPPLVEDIVASLVRDVPGIQIVARVEPGDDLHADFERAGADLMICARDEAAMDAAWAETLRRRPPVAFLNLADEHTVGRLYALRGEMATVGDLSAEALLELILGLGPRPAAD
jgi:hypothetical protein